MTLGKNGSMFKQTVPMSYRVARKETLQEFKIELTDST